METNKRKDLHGGVHLGERIAALRREQGETQGALAAHLGVSKPAVSKWETGQSLPDAALLPVIAAYFGITLDDLFDYRPNLSREEIKKIYHAHAERFSKEPFPVVAADCGGLIKRYYRCYPMVFMMGVLLLNHVPLAGADGPLVLRGILPLFERVEREADSEGLRRESLSMRAYCLLALSKPDEAAALLEPQDIDFPASLPALLINAYEAKGEMERARVLIQREIYTNATAIVGYAPMLLHLYGDDIARMEVYYARVTAFFESFSLDDLHPLACLPVHLTAARIFIGAGERAKALLALLAYGALLAKPGAFPPALRGGSLFDRLDETFQNLRLGTTAPRSTALIKKDCLTLVKDDPVFAPLGEEPQFKALIAQLETLQEEEPC